jgi:hypothetical protein
MFSLSFVLLLLLLGLGLGLSLLRRSLCVLDSLASSLDRVNRRGSPLTYNGIVSHGSGSVLLLSIDK